MSVQRTNGLVQTQQAAAAEHGLGTDMTGFAGDLFTDLRLAGVAHRQVDMPTFTGQCHPAAILQTEQSAHAQAGSRADHHCRTPCFWLASTHRAALVRLQPGHAQRHRGKVIDQQQPLDLQGLAEGLPTESPVIVGKAKLIAADRSRHRQADCAKVALAQPLCLQVGADGLLRAGVIGGGEHLDRVHPVVFPEGKAGVGATDITDQGALHLRVSRAEVKALAPCSAGLRAMRRKPNSSRPQPRSLPVGAGGISRSAISAASSLTVRVPATPSTRTISPSRTRASGPPSKASGQT
ncbi:hypothetical protein D3C80_1297000 [compost metagenome]